MSKLICVWLHRGQMPCIATRHSIQHPAGIQHTPMWEWLPYNIYTSGLAEAWPKDKKAA